MRQSLAFLSGQGGVLGSIGLSFLYNFYFFSMQLCTLCLLHTLLREKVVATVVCIPPELYG